MQHHFVRQLRGVRGIALTPVVAHSIGEDISIAVERGTGDSSPYRRIAFQAVLSILIPEVEGTIAAGSAERAMDGVERDCVDGVDIVDVPIIRRGFAMALEAEVGTRVFLFDILDGTATLDTADGKARSVCKAADYPSLPLERGLHGLVEFGRVVEVDDVDVPVSSADDE